MRTRKIDTYVSSVAVAFYAVVPTLNMILTRITGGGGEKFMARLYLLVLGVLFLSILFFRGKSFKPYQQFWVVLLFVASAFLLTRLFGANSLLEPLYFFMFTIVSFVIPQLVTVDVKTMLRAMMVIPSFGIVFFNQIFEWEINNTVTMELTYSFLSPIVASFVYLFTYFKVDTLKEKIVFGLFASINVVYFVFCLLFGSRGPSLSVFLCILFLLCTSTRNGECGYSVKPVFWFWLFVIILISSHFEDLLRLGITLVNSFGLEAESFQRALDLYMMGNLDDGRAVIVPKAISGFFDSFVYGYGLSSSQMITGHPYPHNFLLQLLLDGGIILFLAVMVPMISSLYRVFKRCSYDEYVLICVLFFASIPGALFSLDLWTNQRVWLFMGFLLSRRFVQSARIKSDMCRTMA
jgi:hypothetical protein